MKNIFTIGIFFLLISSVLVMAHGEEDFSQAEEIIEEKISCDDLTDDQLEVIGDYYMEQMHPGELHEIMDERMGGEGSESLRQAHITMALSFYCGEHQSLGAGMMDTMMERGMMGPYNSATSNSFQRYKVISTVFIVLLLTLVVILMWKLFKKGKGSKKK